MLNKRKNYNKLFIIFIYALFWIFLLASGILIMLFGEKLPMQLFFVIGSWTPTITLLVMFKNLKPNTTRREFFKNLFKSKINWKMLAVVTVIQFLLVLVSIAIVAFQNKFPILSLLNLSIPMLSYAFFISLITGATGEEAAWRGYLFPVMVKKSGVIKGNILLGFIWAFWHGPLWLFTSGFWGLNLLVYIGISILLIVSISVIIGICYNYNKNLLVPMWIHLISNFSVSFYAGSTETLLIFTTYLAIFYGLTALGFALWYKKFQLAKSLSLTE